LAAAVLAIVVSGSWLFVQNRRFRDGLRRALTGQAELRREGDALRQHIAELQGTARGQVRHNQQPSEVAKLETPTEPVPTLRLTPTVARSLGEPQKILLLPPTASRARLQLMLEQDEYGTYDAVLLTPAQNEVLRGKSMRSLSIGGSSAVVWSLPAQSLDSGDYIVQLKGRIAPGRLEDVASYSFRVLRR
jgi:hypothetical protein